VKENGAQKKSVVVGMSGASGMPVGIALLRALRASEAAAVHLIVTDAAKKTLACECDVSLSEVYSLADCVYDVREIGAAVASGSFPFAGMIVIPCSMKTLAGISVGYADNLLLRAADVTLKERRRLVLAVRECPLSTIHLRNMTRLAEAGADIFPLVMTFYHRPGTIEEMSAYLAARILSRFGFDVPGYEPWRGIPQARATQDAT
jgi:4-hydroxy-3-polyprenylbenzoate decarboxylase